FSHFLFVNALSDKAGGIRLTTRELCCRSLISYALRISALPFRRVRKCFMTRPRAVFSVVAMLTIPGLACSSNSSPSSTEGGDGGSSGRAVSSGGDAQPGSGGLAQPGTGGAAAGQSSAAGGGAVMGGASAGGNASAMGGAGAGASGGSI